MLLRIEQNGKLIILACFWQNKSFWLLAGESLILWRIISASPEPSVTYQQVWSWWGSWGDGSCWSCVSSSSWRSCVGCHISETPAGCSSRLQSVRTASAWSWAGRSEWAAAAGCSLVYGCPDPPKKRRKWFIKSHWQLRSHWATLLSTVWHELPHVLISRSPKNQTTDFNLSDFVPHTASSFWENSKHTRHTVGAFAEDLLFDVFKLTNSLKLSM